MRPNDDHHLMTAATHMRRKIRILFLAANPDDRTRLELGREFIRIRDALLRSKYRDAFQLLEPELGARMGDFSSALIKHRPHIVHFCGHGSADQGIVFEGEDGYSRPAGKQELTALFAELNRDARLVFLNACHTKDQAETLGRVFDYTIGTKGLIMDRDAGDFAGWFYHALADGATVSGAFQAAQSAVDNRVREISELSKGEGADDSRPFLLQVLTPAGISRQPPATGISTVTVVKDRAVVEGGITNMNITGNEPRVEVNQAHGKSRRRGQD
jgi:hypothetical protein